MGNYFFVGYVMTVGDNVPSMQKSQRNASFEGVRENKARISKLEHLWKLYYDR